MRAREEGTREGVAIVEEEGDKEEGGSDEGNHPKNVY